MQQATLDFTTARAAGEQAGNACLEKAKRVDPEFAQRAAGAILRHLQAVGSASGEELTDIAIASGARCHDPRAMGPVFATLSRRGLIRTAGFCMRKKGNGTAGGRLWSICR